MSAKNDKNWCARCGIWGDHTSGSCPDTDGRFPGTPKTGTRIFREPGRQRITSASQPTGPCTIFTRADGVPGGENMILFPDGKVRYLTVREAARVQTFPDKWEFQGAWTEAMRQLGNAVPVQLANKVAHSVFKALLGR